MRTSIVLGLVLLFASVSDARINELRIDQPGSDDSEYFEIFGTPGLNLDGFHYLVIGDGSGGSGTIETAIDLSGNVVPEDGVFLAAESTFGLGGDVDFVTEINFENSDNVTHLVVGGFSAALGDDLDTDDDCALDSIPWTTVIDGLALLEEPNGDSGPPANTECHYGTDQGFPVIGPDGRFVPGHIYSFPNGSDNYFIGQFNPVDGDGTPGVSNVPEPSMISLAYFILPALGLLRRRSK